LNIWQNFSTYANGTAGAVVVMDVRRADLQRAGRNGQQTRIRRTVSSIYPKRKLEKEMKGIRRRTR
jgi:hypothetical protein